jgi:hypothetical protein
MGAYTICQGLITNLSAASVLGPRGISKDYSVLEQTQGPAAVIGWLGVVEVATSFGNPSGKDVLYTFRLSVFIKDTGSASAMMDSAMTTIDKILPSLMADDDVQGTAVEIQAIRAARTPGEGISVGNVNFLPYNMDIDILDWP